MIDRDTLSKKGRDIGNIEINILIRSVTARSDDLQCFYNLRLFEKLLNAEVHTTQELNLLVILPDLSCERPRVRRHLNVKIQN